MATRSAGLSWAASEPANSQANTKNGSLVALTLISPPNMVVESSDRVRMPGTAFVHPYDVPALLTLRRRVRFLNPGIAHAAGTMIATDLCRLRPARRWGWWPTEP